MAEELQSKLISNKQLKLVKDKIKTYTNTIVLSKDGWIWNDEKKCWCIKYNYKNNLSKLHNSTIFVSGEFWISNIDDEWVEICSGKKFYENKLVRISGEYKWT